MSKKASSSKSLKRKIGEQSNVPARPAKTEPRKVVAEDKSRSGILKNLNKTVCDAYKKGEIHMFLHCHLRGYDKTGCGREMTADYFDKYGAPVRHDMSWSEGYREIEKQCATHFDECANKANNLPLIAGYGGGCHLYKPVGFHSAEKEDDHTVGPWNVTGWVPLENKWCCEDKYFRNRHFFALRGNEIQNNLWDYHPYRNDHQQAFENSLQKEITKRLLKRKAELDSKIENQSQTQSQSIDYLPDALQNLDEVDGDFVPHKQFTPIGPYNTATKSGGYWYQGDVRGRYLHIMSIKNHSPDENNLFDRYNYIVHPLAYRTATRTLPDNSVDGMQWSVTNVNNESHFKGGDAIKKWGAACQGIELFNDFSMYGSYQIPTDLVLDGQQVNIYNGTLMNYERHSQSSRYFFWFNTYPLEFGEFLLDSALTMGTYLHPLSANDAFYKRRICPLDEMDADTEGMERALLSDPKGNMFKRTQGVIKQPGVAKNARRREASIAVDKNKDMIESTKFKSDMPYGEDSVFGYTTALDAHRELFDVIDANQPVINEYNSEQDWQTGLNLIETRVIQKLIRGQLYSHTGVFNIFKYETMKDDIGVNRPIPGKQTVPFIIGKKNGEHDYGQCDLKYDVEEDNELAFIFERVKTLKEVGREKEGALIWRYTIQIVVHQSPRIVETSYGYFKLSCLRKTKLNLSTVYNKASVCWIRFTAFNPSNPMNRAWFCPVRGPAFMQRNDELIDIADSQPDMTDLVKQTVCDTSATEFDIVYESGIFQPTVITTDTLDFVFDKVSPEEEEDIYCYLFQSYPLLQPVQENMGTGYSETKMTEDGKVISSIPRITESVHGYFTLDENHVSRFVLSDSWDPLSVRGGQICVYALDNETGQPKHVDHLVLPELPDRCKNAGRRIAGASASKQQKRD